MDISSLMDRIDFDLVVDMKKVWFSRLIRKQLLVRLEVRRCRIVDCIQFIEWECELGKKMITHNSDLYYFHKYVINLTTITHKSQQPFKTYSYSYHQSKQFNSISKIKQKISRCCTNHLSGILFQYPQESSGRKITHIDDESEEAIVSLVVGKARSTIVIIKKGCCLVVMLWYYW